MKRIEKVLEITYDELHNRDWDNVLLVVGDEGSGKSNLVLWIMDWWINKKYGKITPEDIKYINLDIGKWADSLANCKKGDINVLDESGDLTGRRAMSNLNIAVNRAYQIIRGDCINSILVLPDLFWLDGFFTKRRARGLIKVYARGKFAFWSRDKLRKIIDLNANRVLKSELVVTPTFRDTFPKYNGVLKKPYDDTKKSYMTDVRKELAETIKDIKGKNGNEEDLIGKKIAERKDDGLTNKQIADELGLDNSTVGKHWKRILSKRLADG